MSDNIRADFATYRPVPTRKVLQLIFEVPIEHQAEVFAKLGFPVPDASTWCEISLLRRFDGKESHSDSGVLMEKNRIQTQIPASQPGSRPPVSLPASPAGPKRVSPSARAASEGANGLSMRSIAGKERYAAADEMERAVIDAAMLANDPAFWAWTKTCYTEEMAADYIREECGVKSRAEFAMNPEACARFRRLQDDFKVAVGRLAESR